MDTLSSPVLFNIVDKLDARSCARLAAVCSATKPEPLHRCRVFIEKWKVWLGDTYVGTQQDCTMLKRGHQLDMSMFSLVSDDDLYARTFHGLDNRERRWLHVRAASLELVTTTYNRTLGHKHQQVLADVLVTKPRRWIMAWDDPPTSPFSVRAEVALRRVRRQSWRGWCESCQCELCSWSAFYELSLGLGPYCGGCLELDDELRDLSWESKSDSFC